MKIEEILQRWRGGLIVSCQAATGSPLARPEIITAMARVAEENGAAGVRLEGADNIKMAAGCLSIPVLGLEKTAFMDSEVYITPTLESFGRVAQSGADIIALDATERPRPGGECLPSIVREARSQWQKPIMADVATLEQGIYAAETLGVEVISTTLAGYTKETAHLEQADFRLVAALASRLSVPIVCEGRLRSPADVRQAFECGAFAVVVGAAITGLDWLVRQYVGVTPAFAGHKAEAS
jgi:N-acylglucosamine-6-phosphate 2-epimerase